LKSSFIFEGRRLPVGNFLVSLRAFSAVELGVRVITGALEAAGISPSVVEGLIAGNVVPTGAESLYLSRHVALKSGMNVGTPTLNVNRLCGSGLEAIIQAAHLVDQGANVTIACGVESMSQAPYVAEGARTGIRYGDSRLVDLLSSALTDPYINQPMGRTAETLAQDFSISRQEQDDWALTSQVRAEKAQQWNRLSDEIISVDIREGKGTRIFDRDEFVRGQSAAAKLPSLPSVFLENGTVTAGNSSGINDGASAMIVCSEAYWKERGQKPLARILGWAAKGCAPERMGLGPVHAIPPALAMAGVSQRDIGLWEINEAFAAQFLAVQKSLKLDLELTNVNGGAVAIGHPLGASGNRIVLTLVKEMRRREIKYGCASLCIGGGQGIAIVVEGL